MIDRSQRFKVDEPKIAAEDFDGEFVVLNLESGQYFSFAEAGALIWQSLANGMNPNELLSQVEGESTRAGEVIAFIEQIIAAGLIVEANEASAVSNADLAAKIAQDDSALNFEAFDDLAALLVADPIHEVEREAGWPHKAPE